FKTDLPATATVLTGVKRTLAVVATGTPLPTYQWRKDGADIPNARAASYVVPATTVPTTATYSVVITNAAGSLESTQCVLSSVAAVSVPPSGQPQGRNVVAGQSASFTVTPSGTGPFTYQWLKKGVVIAGATSQTYTIPAVSALDAAAYSVRVSNGAATVTSQAASLKVITPFNITGQPNGAIGTMVLAAGTTKTLTVTVAGAGPFTYQWRRDGQPISGATLASYVVQAGAVVGTAVYDVVITGPVSSTSSSAVRVETVLPPSFLQHPASVARALGQPASFSVSLSGTGPFAYQWLKNGVAITGATGVSYTVESVVATSAGNYSVRVTGPGGSATSLPGTLSLQAAPVVSAQPANQYKAAGQSAIFSVSATGTGPLSYQWSKDGNPIPGANSSSYYVASVSAAEVGRYSVSVSNAVGSVLSQEA
ncbi:MAG: immunoglobulin domain-containing protein, partial [Candidatus Nanopelagicales bacterium]